MSLEAHAHLDFVSDVGNHLNRVTQVLTAALLGNNFLIDLPGGDVGGSRKVDIQKTLVVTNVEVSFCPIIGHEHFTVLERVHGPRVDVQIRVKLLHDDLDTPAGQEIPERRGSETFSEGRDNASGHKNVFCDVGFGDFRSSGHGTQE